MKTFTDAETQAIKTAALERFDGRTLCVDLGEPIDATIVVAPFDRESYAAWRDAKERDLQTAYAGVLLTRLLWPSFADIEAIRQEWPLLAESVAAQLVLEAGYRLEAPRVRRLTAKDPPAGMSAEEAKARLEGTKGKLWAVDGGELACVMQSPAADTWLAARSLHSDAISKCKGIIAATEPYVLDAVKWSSVPLLSPGGKGLLDRLPALYWDLWQAFLALGGDGAAVRRKSL